MDKKILAELEKLYENEDWTEEERRSNIKFAYDSIMAQQAAQSKYGAVNANDPKAVAAAVEQRRAENGGTLMPKPVENKPAAPAVPQQNTAASKPAGTAASNAAAGFADAEKQMISSVNAATNAAVAAVENSVAEANERFQAQRDAVALEEAQAADNSALYSQLRGDNGGVGKAQYDSIRNTAAVNRAEINRAQIAFAREAAVEIANLQAKGEYEKAEKLLDIAQERLAALSELDRWQAEFNAEREEFDEKLRQWQAEYELAVAEVTGVTSSGEPTAEKSAELAAMGEAMLKKGLMPSAAQLKAMGMTAAQAREYINRMKAEA